MSSHPAWRSEAFLKQRVITAARNPIHFTQDLREVRENSRTYLVLQKADMNQSQMALLTSSLVIFLLTTASAKPIRWRWHHDADIPDNSGKQGWLDRNSLWSWWCSDSSGYEDSAETERETDQSLESWESSESSESESSEESSEEVLTTDPTIPAEGTTANTATTMGDGGVLSTEPTTMGDGGVLSTEPTTMGDGGVLSTEPTTMSATPTPVCVTHLIPTTASSTENRGDN